MVKPEKPGHLHLFYPFTVSLRWTRLGVVNKFTLTLPRLTKTVLFLLIYPVLPFRFTDLESSDSRRD